MLQSEWCLGVDRTCELKTSYRRRKTLALITERQAKLLEFDSELGATAAFTNHCDSRVEDPGSLPQLGSSGGGSYLQHRFRMEGSSPNRPERLYRRRLLQTMVFRSRNYKCLIPTWPQSTLAKAHRRPSFRRCSPRENDANARKPSTAPGLIGKVVCCPSALEARHPLGTTRIEHCARRPCTLLRETRCA